MIYSRPVFVPIWPLLGFVMLCGIYYWWGWSHVLGGFGGDNAFYLLTAQYFSPWNSPSQAAAYFATHNQYPPLYPLMLAIFGGGGSLLVAHIITVSFLLLAFVMLYAWMRFLRISVMVTAFLVFLFALLPGTYLQVLEVLSENLYLFLTLACLVAVAAFENDRRVLWLWLAVVSLAGATLTRSAGVALILAFLVYLIWHRPPRFWLLALSAVAPVAVWNLFGSHETSGYVNTFLAKYNDVDSFSSLFHHLAVSIKVMARSWVGNFTGSQMADPLLWLLAAVCIFGALYRLYRGHLDGMYAIAYLGLVWIWPYPAETQRLLFVIVPVLLVQAVLLMEMLPELRLSGRNFKFVSILFVALFMTALPDLILTAGRYLTPLPDAYSHYKRLPDWYATDPNQARMSVTIFQSLVTDLENIRDKVPESECIYSIKPSLIGYFSQRISHAPPLPSLDKSAFNAAVQQPKCRYIYMMSVLSPTYPELLYPLSRIHQSVEILNIASTDNVLDGPVALLAEWKRR